MKIFRWGVVTVSLALLASSVTCKATTNKDKEVHETIPTTTESPDGHTENATLLTTTTETESTTTEISELEKENCRSMIGRIVDGQFEGREVEYDVAKILEEYGGGPGRVNIKWRGRGDAPVDNPMERPLPDGDEKYWIYDFRDSDNKTYLRTEHALSRFSGVPNRAFLEFRGMILWTPADLCGRARRAFYLYDDRGFSFRVSREYCSINHLTYRCQMPVNCKTISGDHGGATTEQSSVECGGQEESDPLLFGGINLYIP